MSLDPDAVDAIAFDSYGTIVDVMAIEEAIAERVDQSEAVTKLWRNRSLGYAMVGNAIDEYDSFFELNRRALRYAFETLDCDVDEDDREAILSQLHELPLFDDVRGGMERLRDGGYDLYVVSNGSEEMLESMVDNGGLGELLADTISADEVEQFKPDAGLYRHAAERIDAPIEQICYAAAGWWDVPGGVHAGMRSVWVNRQDALWGPYETEPDLEVETFEELADALDV